MTPERQPPTQPPTPARRALVFSLVALCALAVPNLAAAHVGGAAPVATNFEARVSGLEPPDPDVEARVIDGDRTLWLRVGAAARVVVPGVLGEPVLRFDANGVWLNVHSLTAQSDRIDPADLQPVADSHAPPRWHRLTGGHAYAWHEHRLHQLEPLAHHRTAGGALGHWSVPLLIDGRRDRLVGVLEFRPPGPVWRLLLLMCALAVVASAIAARSARTTVGIALVATLLIWLLRFGRELYGRPGVGIGGYLGLAATSIVGAGLLYGLFRPDAEVRVFTALLVGSGGLYQGLTMLPVLTHGIALTALPTSFAQVTVALVVGLCSAAFIGGASALLREQLQMHARA